MKIQYALLLTSCLLLAACGQSGKLFLPGNGKGYYKTHTFAGTKKTSPKKQPL